MNQSREFFIETEQVLNNDLVTRVDPAKTLAQVRDLRKTFLDKLNVCIQKAEALSDGNLRGHIEIAVAEIQALDIK